MTAAAVVSAAWILAVAGTGAGIRVETSTPAALCPDIQEVRRVVHDRLTIEGDGEWVASYDLVHRPDDEAGDIVRLELRDPAGRLRLRRELPRSGASCVALTQAVALVLETYFRHPGEPIDEAPVAVRSSRPAIAAAEIRPAPPQRGHGLVAGLVAGASLGPTSPALALDLSYGGSRRWAAGIEAAWIPMAQTGAIDLEPGQASGSLHSTLFHAWGAARFWAGRPVELLVGPQLALAVDRLQTTGVPDGQSNARVAFGLGGRGELRLWVAPRVAISFVAAADYCPASWAGHFQIQGVTAEPFPPPAARLLLGAGVGVVAFP